MHVCLLLGGPMPKWGGQLKTVCVAAGRNRQSSAKPWPEWPGFNMVTEHFKEYLASAFCMCLLKIVNFNLIYRTLP